MRIMFIYIPAQATHPATGRQPWFQVRRIEKGAHKDDMGTLELDFLPSPGVASGLANNLMSSSHRPLSIDPAEQWRPPAPRSRLII